MILKLSEWSLMSIYIYCRNLIYQLLLLCVFANCHCYVQRAKEHARWILQICSLGLKISGVTQLETRCLLKQTTIYLSIRLLTCKKKLTGIILSCKTTTLQLLIWRVQYKDLLTSDSDISLGARSSNSYLYWLSNQQPFKELRDIYRHPLMSLFTQIMCYIYNIHEIWQLNVQ